MNIIKHSLIAIAVIFSFSSCLNDDEAGEQYADLIGEFAELYTDNTGELSYMITDGGARMSVNNSAEFGKIFVKDTLYRVRALYMPMSGVQAKIFQIGTVTMLNPRTLDADQPMKTDPVGLKSLWVSATKKYINMSLTLFDGNSASGTKHKIMLIDKGIRNSHDGKKVAQLEVYHDQNGIPQHYENEYYFSILTERVAADSLAITASTSNGVTEKKILLTQ